MSEQERREEQGRRVLMARTGARLSRQTFAEQVSEKWEDVSREYVRRVEDGEKDPGLGFLLAAAEVTGLPVSWFIELEAAVNPRYVKLGFPLPWVPRPIEAYADAA